MMYIIQLTVRSIKYRLREIKEISNSSLKNIMYEFNVLTTTNRLCWLIELHGYRDSLNLIQHEMEAFSTALVN